MEVQEKMQSFESKEFKGDVYLNYFVKAKNKYVSEEKVCIRANQYKWLQFYDYSAKVCLTAIYDNENKIVEWYFDIAREIGKENGIPYEEDLYLDVVVKENFEIILLDEEDLQEALEKDEITKEEFKQAYKTANNLMEILKENQGKLKCFTDKYLKIMLQEEKMKPVIEIPEIEDFKKVNKIAGQVHELHVGWRPDLFLHVDEVIEKENFKKMVQNAEIFVAKLEDEIVGYVTLFIKEKNHHGLRYRKLLTVDAICVDEKWRRKGIGKALLNFAKEFGKKKDCTDLYLTVNEENKNAIKVYENFGMKVRSIAYSMEI